MPLRHVTEIQQPFNKPDASPFFSVPVPTDVLPENCYCLWFQFVLALHNVTMGKQCCSCRDTKKFSSFDTNH